MITLPVAWLCGKRFGGRAVAWTLLVLLASAPFAVYYATESRMYALVILLTGCGFLALQRAVTAPSPANLAAVAVVTAALLYAQYWSIYLAGMVVIWLVASIVRTRRHGHPEAAPWAALIAVAAGCLLFVPWLPTFFFQTEHTGTPWAAPPNFSAVINALTGFTDNQGSTLMTATNQGRLLAVIYFAMLALAVFGVGLSGRIIELDLRTRPRARGVGFVVIGTLFAAIAGGILTASAFSSRYAAVVFLPFLLLVALGTTTLLNPRVRVIVVALAVAAGLVSSAQNVTTQRTQAGEVAAAINVEAKPGDIIAFCPDQLGPAVYRQIQDPSQYDMITFPRRSGRRSSTGSTTPRLSAMRTRTPTPTRCSSAPGPPITSGWSGIRCTRHTDQCETIASDLLAASTKAGGGGRNVVTGHDALFYEPMSLTGYATSGP